MKRINIAPGIEQLSASTYRVGTQIWVEQPDGPRKRQWIRETHTYDINLSHDEQVELARADLARLKARCHPQEQAMPSSEDQLTITQLCTMWQRIGLAGQTDGYRKTVTSLISLHIIPHLGSVPANQLTPFQVNSWTAQMTNTPLRNNATKTLSQRTVRHIYITLSTIYNWAEANNLVTASPFKKTHAPKFRRTRPHFLDDDQAVELLRKLAGEENMSFRCAVLMALMCGLRLGEACAVRWKDVNWKRGTIDITRAAHAVTGHGTIIGDTKTEESVRLLTAPAALLTLLDETKKAQQDAKALLGDRYHDHDLIVCNWDGEPYSKDTPSRQWKRFAEANGYTGITFHNLRTSHATILLSNNIDAVAVAGRMGHTDAVTTLKYYAGLVAQRDRDSAAVMDRLADLAANNSGAGGADSAPQE